MPTLQHSAVRDPTVELADQQSVLTVRKQRALARSWTHDALGVLWVIAAGLALLIPALVHGSHLGPFDLLSQFGLSKRSGVVVHNADLGDQIAAIGPWTALAWSQVHHGVLPLWNPYGGLGTPLAFNWQSAPFGLPALIGYAAPLQYAYTVGVAVSVVVAGTGAYFLGRVLHLGTVGCVMAGTVFELSGPFVGWLGWPHASVMSWAGWLFASAILIVRGKSRIRDVAFFAVVFAFAIYAGQPEILIILLLALAVFLFVLLAQDAWIGGLKAIVRPGAALLIAAAAGGALAAPLVLPGLQLARESVRGTITTNNALHPHDLAYLIFQGFDGSPIAGSRVFGDALFYNETAAYVGVIGLVLAIVAVGLLRRRIEVIALAVVVVSTIALVFVPGVESAMGGLPLVKTVAWHRALLMLAFAIAILAGIGVDALIRARKEVAWRWTFLSFAVVGLILLVLFLTTIGTLPTAERAVRARSFIWPLIGVAVGLGSASAVLLWFRTRRRFKDEPASGEVPSRRDVRKWAAVSMVVCETAFLIAAGAPIFSSSGSFYAPTAAEAKLQRIVGSSTVGFGSGDCLNTGIIPDVNDVYGIHELNLYDPTTPTLYYVSWSRLSGQSEGIYRVYYEFCPHVTSVALARRYGVQFVLEPDRTTGPSGSMFVAKVGDENLYRIPGAAAATVTPLSPGGGLPPAGTRGAPVGVDLVNPASWKIRTKSSMDQVLRLRLADLPGWHASIDGRPLQLDRFSGIMMQARIPAGRHEISLHYWPDTFTDGIVLASCSAIGLTAAVVADAVRRRKRRRWPLPQLGCQLHE
jgi:hypothetical protein